MNNLIEANEPFEIQPYGLEVKGSPTFEEWLKYGETLNRIRKAVQWAIGDWINYGERRWGEKYSQAMDDTLLDIHTLRNYASIAAKFDVSRRRDDLSWSHHSAVASLPEPAQESLLKQAVQKEWTRDEIRDEAKKWRESQTPVGSTPQPITAPSITPVPEPAATTPSTFTPQPVTTPDEVDDSDNDDIQAIADDLLSRLQPDQLTRLLTILSSAVAERA